MKGGGEKLERKEEGGVFSHTPPITLGMEKGVNGRTRGGSGRS